MEDQLDQLTDFVCNTTLISASKLQSQGSAVVQQSPDLDINSIDEFGEALLMEIEGLPIPKVQE